VATALLALASSRAGRETLLVDLSGDQTAILGLGDEPALGVRQWLEGGPSLGLEALERLKVGVTQGLNLVATGTTSPVSQRPVDRKGPQRLLATLESRSAIVDAGTLRSAHGITHEVVAAAATSILVTRPCFLAVRRASAYPVRPSGVIVVDEPGRSLDRYDVEDVLGVPVLDVIRWDSSIARAVDAGQLCSRNARLAKPFEKLASSLFNDVGVPVA